MMSIIYHGKLLIYRSVMDKIINGQAIGYVHIFFSGRILGVL